MYIICFFLYTTRIISHFSVDRKKGSQQKFSPPKKAVYLFSGKIIEVTGKK